MASDTERYEQIAKSSAGKLWTFDHHGTLHEGERRIGQCHWAQDAERIATAMNKRRDEGGRP